MKLQLTKKIKMMKYFGVILGINYFQVKNDQIINNINDRLIDLRNAINRKEIPENENPKKIVNIVEKFSTLIISNKQVKEFNH